MQPIYGKEPPVALLPEEIFELLESDYLRLIKTADLNKVIVEMLFWKVIAWVFGVIAVLLAVTLLWVKGI